jgi:hypothetical protein
MSRNSTMERRPAAFWSFWITALLAVGACSLFPWFLAALEDRDIEALESPLVLAAARQLEHSPWELYGPYDQGNRLVLIHAPLYYRVTALVAWPLFRAGLDPVLAALATGRLLSLAGFLVTLGGVFRLARLGGAPPLAGWWAALLAAATPVYGGLPLEVRPDLMGVALQTTGVLLLLSERVAERPRSRIMLAAFVCLGLAVCIKQQFIAVPAVSAGLLLSEWQQGRLPGRSCAVLLLAGLGIAAAYYGFEQWATRGFMSRSVFVAAAAVGRVHPAGWFAALNIVLAVIWKCVGLILLFAAAGLCMVSTRDGVWSGIIAGIGVSLIAATALLAVLQFFVLRTWVSGSIVVGLSVILVGLIPICHLTVRLSGPQQRVDAALWVFLAAELALLTLLCKLSTGAWYNYAIQAAVFGSVLAARTLARGFESARSRMPLVAAAFAVIAVPAFALTDLEQVFARRVSERAITSRLLNRLRRPCQELFFVDRPGDNRIHGRSDLVYDPWLFAVFESTGQAEPRQIWLVRELAYGAVRAIVTTSHRPVIDGITPSIAELGYRQTIRVGPYLVWERRE